MIRGVSDSGSASDAPIRQLSSMIGIEISADLARPLEEDVFRQIRTAWENNCVALFRGQRLDAAQQLDFASRFGSIGRTLQGPPALLEVSNARNVRGIPAILPDGPIDFHSDQSYLETPSIATVLYAIDIPKSGGNTVFANGFLAYQSLPADIKRRLAGRHALHAYDYQTNPTRRPEKLPENAKQAAHSIFRLHPPTGRTVLYVNRLMTWSIIDMDPQESRETLEFLFDHQERAQFVHSHTWRSGDLLIWDNRSCSHARTDFDATECRRLRRVTVLGA